MLNSAPTIEPRDEAIAEDVVLFFKELTKRLDRHEGQITKDTFLNMSLLAANKLPEDSRAAIAEFIDSRPKTFLQNLAKKPEDKSKADVNPVQQAMVAAPVLYAIRKTAIPAIFDAGIPLVANLLVPGSGVVVSKFLLPCVEFTGEFMLETAKGYVQSCEKTPTTVIHNFVGNTLETGWRMTTEAASGTTQRLSRLLGRSSSSVVEVSEPTPSLIFTAKQNNSALDSKVVQLPSEKIKLKRKLN